MTVYELEHRLRGFDSSLEVVLGDGSSISGVVVVDGRPTGRLRTQKQGIETFGQAVSASLSRVDIDPSEIREDTGRAKVVVSVRDADRAPIQGAVVVLTSTPALNTALVQPAVTDGNGVAIGEFSASTPGNRVLSAVVNGVPVVDTAAVRVV